MAKRNQEEVIERGSGNVFADLGFSHADELLAKAKLVHAISETMKSRGVTQREMATMVGVDQAKVSKLLRGVTDGFSSDRLMQILTRLGQDVDIIVRPKPQDEARPAHVSVAVMHSV
jgi:predicted XRE-type DNA-binding protein